MPQLASEAIVHVFGPKSEAKFKIQLFGAYNLRLSGMMRSRTQPGTRKALVIHQKLFIKLHTSVRGQATRMNPNKLRQLSPTCSNH